MEEGAEWETAQHGGYEQCVLEPNCLGLVLLYHLPAVWPWPSDLPSLGLNFLIWKMRTMIIWYLPQKTALIIKWGHTCKVLRRTSSLSKVCSYYQCSMSQQEYRTNSTGEFSEDQALGLHVLRAQQYRKHGLLFQTSWQHQRCFKISNSYLMATTQVLSFTPILCLKFLFSLALFIYSFIFGHNMMWCVGS